MDECHITLFDPWFRRGIRDRLLGILGTSQLQRFKRKNSHKDRQLFTNQRFQILSVLSLSKWIQIPQHLLRYLHYS